MRKLSGNSLQDVLNMTMPQFYFCIESVSREIEAENKAHKKAKNKRR